MLTLHCFFTLSTWARRPHTWSITIMQNTQAYISPKQPEHIRAEPDIGVVRKVLKTHLFNLAFNVHWLSGFYTAWLLECTYVQCVIGALQMHWMMMMMKWTAPPGVSEHQLHWRPLPEHPAGGLTPPLLAAVSPKPSKSNAHAADVQTQTAAG